MRTLKHNPDLCGCRWCYGHRWSVEVDAWGQPILAIGSLRLVASIDDLRSLYDSLREFFADEDSDE